MTTQYVTPTNLAEATNYLVQSAAIIAKRTNPVVQFSPEAHLVDFEYGTKRSKIVIALDALDPFDRLIVEQAIVEDLAPVILDPNEPR